LSLLSLLVGLSSRNVLGWIFFDGCHALVAASGDFDFLAVFVFHGGNMGAITFFAGLGALGVDSFVVSEAGADEKQTEGEGKDGTHGSLQMVVETDGVFNCRCAVSPRTGRVGTAIDSPGRTFSWSVLFQVILRYAVLMLTRTQVFVRELDTTSNRESERPAFRKSGQRGEVFA
jgi:hypothetical protein